MKQASISEESWKTLSMLKLQKGLKTIADALDLIIKESRLNKNALPKEI